jgi:hypothetical protein
VYTHVYSIPQRTITLLNHTHAVYLIRVAYLHDWVSFTDRAATATKANVRNTNSDDDLMLDALRFLSAGLTLVAIYILQMGSRVHVF